MKILVLGVTGMLGSAVFHTFNQKNNFDVWGTLRDKNNLQYFPEGTHSKLISNINILDNDQICRAFQQVRPDVVINCVGLIKQLANANDPLNALPINAMLPHRLANLCALSNARMVHISTDCVFSGKKGLYNELDISDAEDLYGKSKFIGELFQLPHVITLRTSIIGHEINSQNAILEWFLSQDNSVKGYKNAIFSGLPTYELARVIRDYIISKPNLFGLYHVASEPISKYDLLTLINEIYKKNINIIADEHLVINRSLNADKFKTATGYIAPSWPNLIDLMYKNQYL